MDEKYFDRLESVLEQTVLTVRDMGLQMKDFSEAMQELREAQVETGKGINDLKERIEELGVQFNEQLEDSGVQFNERLEESGRQFNERLEESGRQFNERLEESGRQFNERLEDSGRQFNERAKVTDWQIKEVKEELRETGAFVRETSEKVLALQEIAGNFFGNSGQISEEFFFRSLEDEMRLGDVLFDRIERRVQLNKNRPDYDIVLINGESVGIVEVKNKAHPEEVGSIAEKQIRNYKKDFPEYANFRFYFGIASMVTNPDLINSAKEGGIFLMTQKGGHLVIVNGELRSF